MSAAVLLAAPALSGARPWPEPTVKAERDTEPVVVTGERAHRVERPRQPDREAAAHGRARVLPVPRRRLHLRYAQQLRAAGGGHPKGSSAGGSPGWPAAGLPLGRGHAPLRPDPVPGRRGLHALPRQLGVRVRLLLGQDQHTTYAYDREGFRFTESDPNNPCVATPGEGPATTPDPVQGLDGNDEVVFMAEDAGPQAPTTAPLPDGIEDARRIDLTDPLNPLAQRFVYVMKAAPDGPRPAFDASNGYVSYERDANADYFEKSESSYDGYGNARRGRGLRRRGQRDRRRRASSPARLRDRHDRPLPVPLRRPLAAHEHPRLTGWPAGRTGRT